MLFDITSSVGTLLENATKNRMFGHYADIFVELDLSKHMFDEVMMERYRYVFYVEWLWKIASFWSQLRYDWPSN